MTIGLRVVFVLMVFGGVAVAEGEGSPMFGGGVIATHGPENAEIAGVELELAFWRGRVGLAVEGTRQWSIDGDGPRVAAIGASARLLLFQTMMPSLLEPRDVELGVELQAIVERAWWERVEHERSPIGYGLGVAVRLRGGPDDYGTLLAESRIFVRAMTAPRVQADAVARDTMLPLEREGLTVMIGLGALWGRGEQRYVAKFDPRPLDALQPFGR